MNLAELQQRSNNTPNDFDYIEGKIEGQSIMIKTMYVRKQGA